MRSAVDAAYRRGAGSPHKGLRPWLETTLGEPIASLRPLSWSDQNMVAQVTTSTGRSLVARVSGWADVAWRAQLFHHCWTRGLPVPRVVASGSWGAAGALVLEHIQGVPLDRMCTPGPELMAKVGRILARLHSIPTTGAGPMEGPAEGSAPSWADVILAIRERPIRPPTPHASEVLEGALTALERLRCIDAPLCFVHGDWAPRHVLVDAGGSPWIIDVDDALVGDPAWDFACWEHQSGHMDRVADLMAGYREIRGLGADFALRIRLHRLSLHAAVLADAWERGAPDFMWESLVARMAQDTRAVHHRVSRPSGMDTDR